MFPKPMGAFPDFHALSRYEVMVHVLSSPSTASQYNHVEDMGMKVCEAAEAG